MNPETLANSRRRFERLTYSPLILPPPADDEPGDAFGRVAMIRALELTSAELDQIEPGADVPQQREALVAIRALTDTTTGAASLLATQQLAQLPVGVLRWFGDALARQREQAGDDIRDGLQALDRQMALLAATANVPAAENLPLAEPVPAPQSASQPASLPAGKPNAGMPVLTGDRPGASHVVPARAAPVLSRSGMPGAAFPAWGGCGGDIAAAVGPQLGGRVDAVTSWGLRHAGAETSALIGILRASLPFSSRVDSLSDGLAQLLRRRRLVKLFLDGLTRRALQPLGLLHLDRLDMTPLAVERGELVYSLPLSPREKVTLAHREWTLHKEEFSELIADRLENFSETGVAESNDIALSSATQTQHQDSLDMSKPVAATATGVTLTAPVTVTTGTSSVGDTTTQEQARAQTRTVTARASARTLRDHKTSFTVTTVAGMEDFTAHILENGETDKVMLVDYFARVRNWRSDLYRYGVRLAYDVVLPDPGARLRARWTELLDIDEQLRSEFAYAIPVSAISRSSWQALADSHGVTLPAPPEPVRVTETVHTIETRAPSVTLVTDDGVKWTTHQMVVALSIDVPDGWRLDWLNVFANVRGWNNGILQWVTAIAGRSWMSAGGDADGFIHLDWTRGPFDVPTTGKLVVGFRIQNAMNGELKLSLACVPADAAMATWQSQCWVLLQQAAQLRDGQHRAYLRERAASLRRQIAAEDALHLRRLECEQVMRLVLSWLFPGFDDAASMIGAEPNAIDAARWQKIMEYGEYIKFVQDAIDWDHVTVFLYPYFWDNQWHAREKLMLEHPDARHREFLRAGAARVIIAIQPGFEQDIVSLLDKGRLGTVTPRSRFGAVIDDVHQANLAFAQAGGPDSDPATPAGTLIGSWTDYTPTSGIDMAVTLSDLLSV